MGFVDMSSFRFLIERNVQAWGADRRKVMLSTDDGDLWRCIRVEATGKTVCSVMLHYNGDVVGTTLTYMVQDRQVFTVNASPLIKGRVPLRVTTNEFGNVLKLTTTSIEPWEELTWALWQLRR